MCNIGKISILSLVVQVQTREKRASNPSSDSEDLTTRALAQLPYRCEDFDDTILGKANAPTAIVHLQGLAKTSEKLQRSKPIAADKAWTNCRQSLQGFNPSFGNVAAALPPIFEDDPFFATRGQPREASTAAKAIAYKTVGDKVSAEKVAALERLLANDISPKIKLPDSYDPRTRSGRWRYIRLLGTGSNAVIYHAFDMVGKLGDVAIKICKSAGSSEGEWAYRRLGAFLLHREAQFSIAYLHNFQSSTFNEDSASLFARYLEDHTGDWSSLGSFDEQLEHFENPDFDWWAQDQLRPPPTPYVVMELVHGATLRETLKSGDAPVDDAEGRSILARIAKAIGYMYRCGLIHRDIHENNVIVRKDKAGLSLQIIDLGLAIPADERHRQSISPVVHSDLKTAKWAPPEVKAFGSDTNFALPAFSFDIYSLGILVQQLAKHLSKDGAPCPLGLPQFVLRALRAGPQHRPEPDVILAAIEGAPSQW